jgi:hypothetical protein
MSDHVIMGLVGLIVLAFVNFNIIQTEIRLTEDLVIFAGKIMDRSRLDRNRSSSRKGTPTITPRPGMPPARGRQRQSLLVGLRRETLAPLGPPEVQ